MDHLNRIARSLQSFVVDNRRAMHAMPELRWQEEGTLLHIERAVRTMADDAGLATLAWELPVTDPRLMLRKAEGGIWFDYTVDPTLDRIILRADVDALPIKEATGLPFASENEGKMHACGHDIHSAIMLGAIKAILSGDVQLKHNLRFVFQRAEENPGTAPRAESGGEVLVKKDGVLQGVSAAYGLHIWNNPKSAAGTFYSRPGGLMGNSGRIKFVIKATGGHVMNPSGGSNALRITQAIQNTLDSFLARHFDSTQEAATLEPVILKSGEGSNVMPASAELWYGFRTMLPRDEHFHMMDLIEQEVQGILTRFPGAELVECVKIGGHPATINSAEKYAEVRDILTGAGERVVEHKAVLGGEDFAWYLEGTGGIPGGFWFLASHSGEECGGDHHTPTFSPDESVFWKGVLFWLLLATS